MNTKNGLLVYTSNKVTNIFNIGDYIQSLAAAQFFNNEIDVYVNREHLNEYIGDDIKLIMNGWFLHEPNNWPPSFQIHPLFVAFHLNSTAYQILEDPNTVEYFKKYAPIGCRDKKTVEVLESKGIEAYFSGCMTLTLGKAYTSQDREDKAIIFTDSFVPFEIGNSKKILFTIKSLFRARRIFNIVKKRYNKVSIASWVKSSIFYFTYSQCFDSKLLLEAEHYNHEMEDTFASEDEKLACARSYLLDYANAKLVITSKIHCALPCLALGTPVIYIDTYNDSAESTCRLDGLLDLFNIVQWNGKRFISSDIKEQITRNSAVKNKPRFTQLRDKLIQTCSEFVNKQ